MVIAVFIISIQCSAPSAKKPGLYTDRQAMAFKEKIAELEFPATIDSACAELGIDRARLEHSRIVGRQGVFGSRWALLSENCFIIFYFATPQPDNPARSTERIYKISIIRHRTSKQN